MQQKILVIDDQQDMLDIMQMTLEAEGYQVSTLIYVDDISSAMATFQPDLVILDHLLAGVNGGELCLAIKANPATAFIPVVLLSAYPRLREAYGCYGSDAFLAKPFDLPQLTATVKSCLDNATAAVA